MRKIALSLLMVSCSTQQETSTFVSSPGVSTESLDHSSSSSEGEAGSTLVEISSESGILGESSSGAWDLGGPDFPGFSPGCQGKIDFLISISENPSMDMEQEALKASFPAFLETIGESFSNFDYHIMIPNMEDHWGDASCANCVDVCENGGPGYPCTAEIEICDETQGAGQTFPAGFGASNKRCVLQDKRRYIAPGEPDVPGAFSCLASVGTSGYPFVMNGVNFALSDVPKFCNVGFLREDALLVVIVVSDVDDFGSNGQPETWVPALLEAKQGDPEGALVLMLLRDSDLPEGLCKPYDPVDDKYFRLRRWGRLVPHAFTGSTCAPSFAPFFEEAAGYVKSQCEVFVPPR